MLKESPVDRGILRNAWKVVRHPDGSELVNDQPYAGILERGSRPFKISKEGIIALAGWVKRKILAGNYANVKTRIPGKGKGNRTSSQKKLTRWALDDEALSIAYAIARSWAKVGRKGKYFVLRNLNKLAALMDDEITRSLSNFFNRP